MYRGCKLSCFNINYIINPYLVSIFWPFSYPYILLYFCCCYGFLIHVYGTKVCPHRQQVSLVDIYKLLRYYIYCHRVGKLYMCLLLLLLYIQHTNNRSSIAEDNRNQSQPNEKIIFSQTLYRTRMQISNHYRIRDGPQNNKLEITITKES